VKKLAKSLYVQVLASILVGVLFGHFFPELGTAAKPLSDAFIKCIKMLIAPIVFCTVVLGLSGMENVKKIGRVGVKSILYFEVLTTIALLLGLVVVHLVEPGTGMHVDVAGLDKHAIDAYQPSHQKPSTTVEFLLNIIPSNLVDAFAKGDLLQVLFFSVLFGMALATMGDKTKPVTEFLNTFSEGLFGLIGFIMKFAPVAAFGAMAFTVGKYGLASLAPLAKLMGSFYLTCFLFVFLVLGGVLKFMGINILQLLKQIKEELLIVLGTSSSESALPSLMKKLEKLGCSRSVVGLVVPTGYSFNLDGTCIYLTMAALFIAQATDTPVTLGQQITLLLVLLLTSKGAAAVTGGGFITLAATLPTTGNIPVVGLVLIIGIDRFMSEARAITNLIGNTVATVVIAKWEGELNVEQLRKSLELE
jgi:aerobic C4-dicarboxylate transport protein